MVHVFVSEKTNPQDDYLPYTQDGSMPSIGSAAEDNEDIGETIAAYGHEVLHRANEAGTSLGRKFLQTLNAAWLDFNSDGRFRSIVFKFLVLKAQACEGLGRLKEESAETLEKIKEFVLTHKREVFFAGCALVTAYLSPMLFVTSMAATVIIRYHFSKYLQKLADESVPDPYKQYIQTPIYGPNYISNLDMTLEKIAAADVVTLTLLGINASAIPLFPILGGIAAGNVLTKLGTDMANEYLELNIEE